MKKNNKIYVPIFGGLGNQLFIYAFGRVLIEKYNKEVIFDTSINNKDEILEIEYLNVPYFKKTRNIFSINFKFIKYFQFFPNFLRIYLIKFFSRGLIKNIEFEKNIDLGRFGLESFPGLKDDVFDKLDTHNYFYGYWQPISYFNNIKKILSNDFSPKKAITEKLTNINFPKIKDNNVMLHIRGNHYGGRSDKYLVAAGDQYYLRSINFFKKKLNNPFFYVFTDDIKFAKETLKNIFLQNNYQLISDYNLNSVEEFYLMTNFKNFIIPKSTFSWWAGYLAKEKNKIILMPNNWLKKEKSNKDKMIEGMIEISEL